MANITETYGTDIKHANDLVRNSSGDLETISGLENMKQAIFRRIMTSKGSIIHRPNYGVGLKSFQNATFTLATKRKIALEIQEQLEEDPRIEAVSSVSVDAESNSDPDMVQIQLSVKLVGYGETEMNFTPFGE